MVVWTGRHVLVDQQEQSKVKKRKRCFLLAGVAFIIWALGAWLLWHWSVNLPAQPDREETAPFELLPRAEGS